MIGQTNKNICSGNLQRALRNNMSDAERALWHFLRCRQICGLRFRRQHPYGDFILDFVCLENKLIIEVDGGQHGQQARYDENRTQKLQTAGFRVLRFWNNEVLKEIESVKEKIWLVVQEMQSHPPPNLPLEEGGGKRVLSLEKGGVRKELSSEGGGVKRELSTEGGGVKRAIPLGTEGEKKVALRNGGRVKLAFLPFGGEEWRRGVTLVELLVAIVITGILAAGFYRGFINQQRVYTVQGQVADMQQNARIALGQMIREIRMAGFGSLDYVLGLSGGVNGFTQVVTTNSDSITIVGAFIRVSTLHDGASIGATQVTLDNATEASEFNTSTKKFISIGGIESNIVINQSGDTLTLNTALTRTHPAGAPVFQIRAIGYRQGESFGKQVLERNQNNGVTGFNFYAAAENIDNLQFQYFDKDGSSTSTPEQVRLVKVTVTAKTDMVDPEFKGGDGYRRRTLSSSVRLRNF